MACATFRWLGWSAHSDTSANFHLECELNMNKIIWQVQLILIFPRRLKPLSFEAEMLASKLTPYVLMYPYSVYCSILIIFPNYSKSECRGFHGHNYSDRIPVFSQDWIRWTHLPWTAFQFPVEVWDISSSTWDVYPFSICIASAIMLPFCCCWYTELYKEKPEGVMAVHECYWLSDPLVQ